MTQAQELLTELNLAISLLEAKLPASLENPANQRLANGLERDMAEYFRQLEMAMPMADIEAIYYKRVKQD